MSNYQFKNLNISQINVDQSNPRLEKTYSQKEAINRVVESQGSKIVALARHIAEHGLNPTERTLVFKEGGKYVDGDGNRRVTVLKILETPDILDNAEWKRKIKSIQTRAAPRKIECVIFKNRQDAKLWISLNHQGQGEGEGRIPWGSKEKDRFNDTESIGTQITNKYASKTNRNKYQKTTMDRVFEYKFIRELVNIEKDQNGIVDFAKIDTKLTKNVVKHLEGIKVAEVYNVEKTKKFLESIIAKSSKTTKTKPTTQSRRGVIPKGFRLRIADQKTNNIFDELKRIEVSKFPNASAVLIRTFLELTVEIYCKQQGITLNPGMKLKAKFQKSYKNMNLSKNEEKVINSIIADPNNPANTNILNSYVHNLYHHPDAQSVKTAFDNLKPFFVEAFKK